MTAADDTTGNFLLVFVSSPGRHVYVIKIPLLCPTLRAKFCGLRIFGCLVTGLLLFCFYLNFLGVLLSILSDGVGGVCEFSSTRKNSVLLVRSEAEDEDNLSRLSICRVSIPRRRIITNHFFHPPSLSTKDVPTFYSLPRQAFSAFDS